MKLFSAACKTQVVVVRASPGPLDLRCGGRPLETTAPDSAVTAEPAVGFDGGTLLGKRYADQGGTLELLCTRAGNGSLAIGESKLELKGAKPLPASD